MEDEGDTKFSYQAWNKYISIYLSVVCGKGQNKRIAPLSYFHGCRKRRLKDNTYA
jgi:hypothetical protein